jgi:chaperonin GroEL
MRTNLITNDGVTIARAVKLSDEAENLGAEILREASIKTNERAGDGTTSAIVWGGESLTLADKHIQTGASPILIKNGLNAAAEIALTAVENLAIPANDYEKLCSVAINSCANETDGKTVAAAIEKSGENGIVIIEENTRGETTLTHCDGMESSLAFASPYFAQTPAKLESTILGASVVVFDGEINSINNLVPLLETAQRENLKLVIAAADFDAEVVAALVLNRVRAGIDVTAIRCTKSLDCSCVLGDFAAACGTEICACDDTILVPKLVQKLCINMQKTCVLVPKSVQICAKIDEIRGQISVCCDEFLREKLQKRLANLSGGVAIISVGCATEVETHERKLRFDDALMAAKCARLSGIVAGGGVTYLHAAREIEKQIKKLEPKLQCGAKILAEALQSVLKQICINAGVSADLIINKLKRARAGVGYDAMNCKFCDMFKSRIIDPAAVIKNVIQNAVSVAGTLLTTEAIVA